MERLNGNSEAPGARNFSAVLIDFSSRSVDREMAGPIKCNLLVKIGAIVQVVRCAISRTKITGSTRNPRKPLVSLHRQGHKGAS